MSSSPGSPALYENLLASGMNENAAQILVAALHLFAEKGYAATSVREIVSDADMTNPMLYYYFESKKGVFLALMNFLMDSMQTQIEETLDQNLPFRRRLRGVIQAHFEACRDAPEVLRFIYSVFVGPRLSRPDYDVAAAYEWIHEMVEGEFAQAIASGEFQPARDREPTFLMERFMGMLNNELMTVLTIYNQAASQAEVDGALDELLSDERLDDLLDFFFGGAGTAVGEER